MGTKKVVNDLSKKLKYNIETLETVLNTCMSIPKKSKATHLAHLGCVMQKDP